MMTRALLTVTRQERLRFSVEHASWGDGRPPLKSFARAGALALAIFLVLALAPPTQAQVFDDVVSTALDNDCQVLIVDRGGLPAPGGELADICNFPPPPGPTPTNTIGPSGGSITAQTRQTIDCCRSPIATASPRIINVFLRSPCKALRVQIAYTASKFVEMSHRPVALQIYGHSNRV